jgi:hypothetical protein
LVDVDGQSPAERCPIRAAAILAIKIVKVVKIVNGFRISPSDSQRAFSACLLGPGGGVPELYRVCNRD